VHSGDGFAVGDSTSRIPSAEGRPLLACLHGCTTVAGTTALGGDKLAAPVHGGDGFAVGDSTSRIPSAGGWPLLACLHGGTTAVGATALDGDDFAAPVHSGDGFAVGDSTSRIPSAEGWPPRVCLRGRTTVGGRLDGGSTAVAAFDGVRTSRTHWVWPDSSLISKGPKDNHGP